MKSQQEASPVTVAGRTAARSPAGDLRILVTIGIDHTSAYEINDGKVQPHCEQNQVYILTSIISRLTVRPR